MTEERSLFSSADLLERARVTAPRARDDVIQSLPSHANVSTKEPQKKVVVIGEDDEPIAELLRDAISDEPGLQAVIVQDGALVLETVRQVHADLLILDIMMPGLSGLEVYDRVRAEDGIRDMPVLFVSAASGQYDGELRKRGITDNIITKPFDLNQLLDRVKKLCTTG